MSFLTRAWTVLSSRRLSVWLMALTAVGYAMWVVPFQVYGVPAWRVRNIATEWAFQALAVALLVNTSACLIAHTLRIVHRMRPDYGPPVEALAGPKAVCYAADLGPEEAAVRASRKLRHRGFRVTRDVDVIRGSKGRFSPLGTLLSHSALLLVAVAALLTSQSLFTGKVVLVEGEAVDLSDRGSYAEPPVQKLAALPDSRIPRGRIELLTVDPTFWRDVQLFNKLEARVLVDGSTEKIRINRPARIGSSWVAVSGFGYAPEIRLERPDGQVESVFMKLKVFPPGSIDQFEIPDSPYRVDMKVFPDASIEGTTVANHTYNLRDPAIMLRVSDITQDTKTGVVQSLLRPGEPTEFLDYTLRVPSIRYYAELRVVTNSGAPWFVAALVVGLVGLVVRFAFRQRVVLIEVTKGPHRGSEIRVIAAAEHWRTAFEHVILGDLRRGLGIEATGGTGDMPEPGPGTPEGDGT